MESLEELLRRAGEPIPGPEAAMVEPPPTRDGIEVIDTLKGSFNWGLGLEDGGRFDGRADFNTSTGDLTGFIEVFYTDLELGGDVRSFYCPPFGPCPSGPRHVFLPHCVRCRGMGERSLLPLFRSRRRWRYWRLDWVLAAGRAPGYLDPQMDSRAALSRL